MGHELAEGARAAGSNRPLARPHRGYAESVPTPWWFSHVAALGRPVELDALSLGALWSVSEGLRFVRDNVDAGALAVDQAGSPEAGEAWAGFLAREAQVRRCLSSATALEHATIRAGGRPPAAFRAHWEAMGFERWAHRDGTPADDYLDALSGTSRLAFTSSEVPFANVNLASRASRVADFLSVAAPAAGDVVFDLGAGSGKLALTVAASCAAAVRGVELLEGAVADATSSAAAMGLSNVAFARADVRDVDLSGGSVFYLYFPFRGAVASAVAATLGALAEQKDITIYTSGPAQEYGEFFTREVDAGRLRLSERRGEFGEVMVLRSERC